MAGPLFSLGAVVVTTGALRLLEEHGMDPGKLLARHQIAVGAIYGRRIGR